MAAPYCFATIRVYYASQKATFVLVIARSPKTTFVLAINYI